MNIVGIDIGGTTIKADLYQSDGRSLNEFREVGREIGRASCRERV